MNTNTPDFDKPGFDKPGLDKPNAGEFDKSEWIAQARRLLDDSADGLDAATLSRLNRARQAALEPRQRRSTRQPWLLPAGLAGACAMLLVVAIWTPHHAAPGAGDAGRSASASTAVEATDTLGGDDSVEFYQDLDFYAWLDAQGKDGSG
jgi:hypothetical protein